MLRLCPAALLLIVSGLLAAPAPVFRPSKASKTPCQVILDGLRETGKATGPDLVRGGIWTLTVEKVVEDKSLKTVVLTYYDRDGKVRSVYTANAAFFDPKQTKKGVFSLLLYEAEVNRPGVAGEKWKILGLELELKPSGKP